MEVRSLDVAWWPALQPRLRNPVGKRRIGGFAPVPVHTAECGGGGMTGRAAWLAGGGPCLLVYPEGCIGSPASG